MEACKRSMSGQMKVELGNERDWMWTVCECVLVFSSVCLSVWLGGR